jgi:prevent-host-death family protein
MKQGRSPEAHTMKKLEATKARQEFADTLNRVAYGHDRIVLQRHGKSVAAVVPVDDLDLIKRCEEEEAARTRKKAARSRKPVPRRSRERKGRAA